MAASNTSFVTAPTNRDAAINLTPDGTNDAMTAKRAPPSTLRCWASEQARRAICCRYRMCVPFRVTRERERYLCSVRKSEINAGKCREIAYRVRSVARRSTRPRHAETRTRPAWKRFTDQAASPCSRHAARRRRGS
jgi:hypothetical protein